MAAPDPHSERGAQPGESGLGPVERVPQGQPDQRPQPVPREGSHARAVPQGPPQARAQPLARARPILVEGGKGSTTVHDRQEEPREELTTVALKNAPPWLVSAVFHMLLMIILGLILLPSLVGERIELETVWAESLGEQLEFDSFLAGTAEDMVEEPVYTPLDLPQVEDPFAAPPELEVLTPNGTSSTSTIDATRIGMALDGREEGAKRALLGAFGGNATTEAAVKSGLRWLAKNQKKDGSWSLTGPYGDGAVNENEVAATAMALLAFQGAGNTHKRGDFKRNVARGWDWLLEEQDGDGNFYHEGPFNHRFYTNGQCTIALCELYGMTKDDKFREPAERAVEYLLRSQSSEGGWKYAPQGRSDTSVTGWIVMALQSARMAYLAIPDDNLRRVERFLDKVASRDGSRYAYERGKEPNPAMTAEALLCRQYLGWPRDDERLVKGVQYLTDPDNLIDYDRNHNVYYWYYAAQVCHHMEGEYWKRWNSVMRQAVPEQQVKKGREAGSWDPLRPRPDEWERYGGRLYVTCLSIYMLEVYYRHLPIYSKVYTYLHRL